MKYLLSLLILFFINTCLIALPRDGYVSIESDKIYTLSNKWFFKAEDNLRYKEIDIDTSDWDLTYSHLPWSLSKGKNKYKENGWFRLNIELDRINPISLPSPGISGEHNFI
ncbi:MAG: hypothetical protein JW864_09060 [Spirochaetes bacterium]|nr:hypothetical protein [Spirochaetota bacterium]